MCCVTFVMLLDALTRLEAYAEGSEQSRPKRIKSWHTDGQFLSLFFDFVVPLTEQLQPRAILIGNAQYLDEPTLGWLLKLRTYPKYGDPLAARHGLILCAVVEPESIEANKFTSIVHNHHETKETWKSRLQMSPMSLSEFVAIVARFVHRNLYAEFSDDILAKQVTTEFGKWTSLRWRQLARVMEAVDQELGPAPASGERRVITEEVLERVRKRFFQQN